MFKGSIKEFDSNNTKNIRISKTIGVGSMLKIISDNEAINLAKKYVRNCIDDEENKFSEDSFTYEVLNVEQCKKEVHNELKNISCKICGIADKLSSFNSENYNEKEDDLIEELNKISIKIIKLDNKLCLFKKNDISKKWFNAMINNEIDHINISIEAEESLMKYSKRDDIFEAHNDNINQLKEYINLLRNHIM